MYRNRSPVRPITWHNSGLESDAHGLDRHLFGKSASLEAGTIIDKSSSGGDDSRWLDPAQFRARGSIEKLKTAINIPHSRASADETGLTMDRAARDFMKGMSHELHTPLHVIIGLCQLLERDRNTDLSPMQRDAVERMERNARALLQTVNHLLVCMRNGEFQ